MSDEEEEISSETTLSESSSDSDDDVIQDLPDKDFFKTLSCLKNRDPRIYDSSIQFFTEPPVVITNKNKQIGRSCEQIVGDKCDLSEQTFQDKTADATYKPSNTKFSLKDLDDDSSSEDELLAFKNTSATPNNEKEDESEYIQFLKGRKAKLDDKQIEEELKPLQSYWNTESLDENEQFLKDYILNRKYLAKDSGTNADTENFSEDERELEEQEEYEHNYNFRFENEENLKIKRFPRNVEGSLRRKNDARSKKRAELAKRKKEEKEKKYQEIKKKQKEKLSEIEERIQKLKELTGNVELGFKDEEILEDFDPEKHDQKMKELFNEDYYNKEDDEYPFPNDDINEWNHEDIDWEDENIDMDCEGEGVKTKKLTRSQKKKLRKKKTYQDIIDITKPSFDPNVHRDFKKYLDEYYSLDCEDFIDDIPCKFKYREVVPNDYGLSIEEILAADDKELNRWASVKKICKRRPEHVEKNEVKIYRMKAQDDSLKKAILKSLYTPPEEQKDQIKKNNESSNDSYLQNMDGTWNDNTGEENKPKKGDHSESSKHCSEAEIINNGTKKKNKKRKKSNNPTDLSTDMMSLDTSQDGINIKKIRNSNAESEGQSLPDTSGNDVGDIDIDKANNSDLNKNGGISQKKKRRKKKKKNKQLNETTVQSISVTNEEKNKTKSTGNVENHSLQLNGKNTGKKKKKSKNHKNKEFSNKLSGKFGIKKNKSENSIVNLSDSRLMAYGIKPKQFRSKVKYSTKTV